MGLPESSLSLSYLESHLLCASGFSGMNTIGEANTWPGKLGTGYGDGGVIFSMGVDNKRADEERGSRT